MTESIIQFMPEKRQIDRLFFNKERLKIVSGIDLLSPHFLFMTLHEDERYFKRLFHFALLLTEEETLMEF